MKPKKPWKDKRKPMATMEYMWKLGEKVAEMTRKRTSSKTASVRVKEVFRDRDFEELQEACCDAINNRRHR